MKDTPYIHIYKFIIYLHEIICKMCVIYIFLWSSCKLLYRAHSMSRIKDDEMCIGLGSKIYKGNNEKIEKEDYKKNDNDKLHWHNCKLLTSAILKLLSEYHWSQMCCIFYQNFVLHLINAFALRKKTLIYSYGMIPVVFIFCREFIGYNDLPSFRTE